MRIRDLDPSTDAAACDAIVAGLPEWFGDPQGIANCAAAVRAHAGLVADDEGVVGFLTWERPDESLAEITWMAVRADRRRAGIGGALLAELVASLRIVGVHELRVTTLSARDPYPPYAQTRAFYRANGFEPVAELDVWGPENPATLLSRAL